MSINLNQYRKAVGMFNNCKNIYCSSCNIYYNKALWFYGSFTFFRVMFICVAYLFSLAVCLMSSSSILVRSKFRISYTYLNTILYFGIIYVNDFWLYNIFMKLCGDVEENPGPKPSSNQIFSICYWNLNGISVHNYIRLSLLRAYLSTHRFDVICLSETYLDSDTSHDDANLEIVGYLLIRADHPSNTKRGGACHYYRNSLAFRLLNTVNDRISPRGLICKNGF